MSNTIELVTQILEMDKELQSLKLENTLLKELTMKQDKPCDCKSSENKYSKAEQYALALGEREMFKNIFRWGDPTISATRTAEGVKYTSFEKFVERYLQQNKERIPVTMSAHEVVEFLHGELMAKYQEKCKESYEYLLQSEQEESEDEE